MPYLTTPDGWIAYKTQGFGPPLLLLHGALGTSRAHFGRVIDRLAGQHRLIMPDLPGHGSSSPRRFFSVDYYDRDASTFARLLEHLDVAPAHVLGFSDGAMMAMVLASERPDLVRSLVAISGQAYIDEPTVASLRSWATPDEFPDPWKQSFIRLHGAPYWEELTRAYVEGQKRILAAGGEVVQRRLSQIWPSTLIMHGNDDTVIDILHAGIVANGIAGSRLVTFDNCGHNVLRDRQSESLDIITEFLNQHSKEVE
jgi:pimeloyl-ACP methyl ester carboxylesterase